MMKVSQYITVISLLLFNLACSSNKRIGLAANEPFTAYLFTYFTGNNKSEESIRFAISGDGYNFRALNYNQPVINSALISSTGGVRDPHILRGADGNTFYMVVTDMVSANGWNSNRAMVLLKSNDLLNWSNSVVNIPRVFEKFKDVNRVWAPQTFYDEQEKRYMVYWSMRAGDEPDKIYYSYANPDFTALETEPKQLFFEPAKGATIDGDIVFKDGLYHLFFKTEGSGSGIKVAVADKLTGEYKLRDNYVHQTKDPVEGAGVFKLNDGSGYILMYDVYTKGRYQFTKTTDLQQFKVVDTDISMNFHPRHGTIIPITQKEAERLEAKWLSETDVLNSLQSPSLKTRNLYIDSAKNEVHIPLVNGEAAKNVALQFFNYPGAKTLVGPLQNNRQAVTITMPGKTAKTYQFIYPNNRNPVLAGFYADPDVLFSNQTNKYYIYPTSDGFTGWSGTYFKTFSSSDLVSWKDEGVILDLVRDVTWAKRNAWAPAILERKINGAYKYFFYYTAAQKIGVAVADHPHGPFKDIGKPLIAQLPEGIKSGQVIDPDVFFDEASGRTFIYWGNGFMAVSELGDDLVSVKPGTTQIITTDKTYREGSHVFIRNGRYYFLWSEDDTRSPNYRVRYGYASSPLGPVTIPQNNIVIEKDATMGIYGAGHNSTLQIPGKDEWYIVYHRFNYPNGIKMGDAAGYNREVCLDKMEFNSDGSIRQTQPTHEGISLK